MKLADPLNLRGDITLTVLGEDGREKHRQGGHNVLCTTGYTALAAALVWAGLQDQAASIGVTNPTYLTPLWGTVGGGAGIAAKSDIQLFNELGRQTVSAGASAPASPSIGAQATWLFYFPVPATPWTITEAGVFAGGTSVPNSGSLIDHYVFSPSIPLGTTDSAILQVSLTLGP